LDAASRCEGIVGQKGAQLMTAAHGNRMLAYVAATPARRISAVTTTLFG
jgi:hypothetical protein